MERDWRCGRCEKAHSLSLNVLAGVTGKALVWILNKKNITLQTESLLSLQVLFSKTTDEKVTSDRSKMETEAQCHASRVVSVCPVYLPKCNRQWQNEIRAVRPNSQTHYWSRAIYWYRNCTWSQQTLKHSCYLMKGLAMSHSRSVQLEGHLMTIQSERPTLKHNHWT